MNGDRKDKNQEGIITNIPFAALTDKLSEEEGMKNEKNLSRLESETSKEDNSNDRHQENSTKSWVHSTFYKKDSQVNNTFFATELNQCTKEIAEDVAIMMELDG